MKYALLLLAIIFFLPHCKPKEELGISSADREMLSSLRKIQAEHDLSDAELSQAVGRYCEIFRVMETAIEDGLITMEDFRNMTTNLKEVEENMLESEGLAAAISLSILKSHQERDMDKQLPFLRKFVASYYNDIMRKKSDKYAGFVNRVNDYAAKDAKLQELLNKSN